jgi:hypothetical protein
MKKEERKTQQEVLVYTNFNDQSSTKDTGREPATAVVMVAKADIWNIGYTRKNNV